MFFKPIIMRWAPADENEAVRTLAADIGLPAKNVRRWGDLDTIPSDWFAAVARAATARGFNDLTEAHFAAVAEQKRLSKPTTKAA